MSNPDNKIHHRGSKRPEKLKIRVTEVDSQTGSHREVSSQDDGSTPRKQIAGVTGTKPIVKIDSRYITIPAETLPSLGVFYQWNEFHVRKFNLMDIKKINKANNTRSLKVLLEVLDSTVEGPAVSDFTIADFWSLMYWHRINSYLSSPMIVEWSCVDPDHVHRTTLKKGDKDYLEPKTLNNSYTVNSSSIEDMKLSNQEEIAQIVSDTYEKFKIILTAPRIGDLVDSMIMIERITDLENTVLESVDIGTDKIDVNPKLVAKISTKVAEYQDEEWYNNLASMIEAPGMDIEAKREILDNLAAQGYGADLVLKFSEFEKLIDHGVKEIVTTKCAGCGVQTESNISVDTFTFFPTF